LFTTTSFSAWNQALACAHHLGVEHGSLFERKPPCQHLAHRFEHAAKRDVGHEAQAPLVDPDQRHAVGGQMARGREHAAVAAEHDREVRPGADLRVVDNRILAESAVTGCLRLDHYRAPLPDQKSGQRYQGFGTLACVV
jgi:hypothetical protein